MIPLNQFPVMLWLRPGNVQTSIFVELGESDQCPPMLNTVIWLFKFKPRFHALMVT